MTGSHLCTPCSTPGPCRTLWRAYLFKHYHKCKMNVTLLTKWPWVGSLYEKLSVKSHSVLTEQQNVLGGSREQIGSHQTLGNCSWLIFLANQRLRNISALVEFLHLIANHLICFKLYWKSHPVSLRSQTSRLFTLFVPSHGGSKTKAAEIKLRALLFPTDETQATFTFLQTLRFLVSTSLQKRA